MFPSFQLTIKWAIAPLPLPVDAGAAAAKAKNAGDGEGEDNIAGEGGPETAYVPPASLWSCAMGGGSIERIKEPTSAHTH